MSPPKTNQTIDPIYEDVEFPIPLVVIDQPSPAEIHPNHDYDDVKYPSQPQVSNHSTTDKAMHSDAAATTTEMTNDNEQLYGVVQKRSRPQFSVTTEDSAPSADTESGKNASSVHGHKIERTSEIDDSNEEETPPHTEEMNELVEDDQQSESDNYDDAVYEVVNDYHDDDIYEVVDDNQ